MPASFSGGAQDTSPPTWFASRSRSPKETADRLFETSVSGQTSSHAPAFGAWASTHSKAWRTACRAAFIAGGRASRGRPPPPPRPPPAGARSATRMAGAAGPRPGVAGRTGAPAAPPRWRPAFIAHAFMNFMTRAEAAGGALRRRAGGGPRIGALIGRSFPRLRPRPAPPLFGGMIRPRRWRRRPCPAQAGCGRAPRHGGGLEMRGP